MEHCSYRHSDSLLVGSPLNVFYRVIPFKQAQTVFTKKFIIEIVRLCHLYTRL
jgi:hypothetical protein